MDETTEDTQPSTSEVTQVSPSSSVMGNAAYPTKPGNSDLRFASGDRQTCASSSRSPSIPSSLHAFESDAKSGVSTADRHLPEEDCTITDARSHALASDGALQAFLPSSPSDASSLLSASASEFSPLLTHDDVEGHEATQWGSREDSALEPEGKSTRNGEGSLFIAFHRLAQQEATESGKTSSPRSGLLSPELHIAPNEGEDPGFGLDGDSPLASFVRYRSLPSSDSLNSPTTQPETCETAPAALQCTFDSLVIPSHLDFDARAQTDSPKSADAFPRLSRAAAQSAEERPVPQVHLRVNLPTQLEGNFQRMVICTLPSQQTFEVSSIHFPYSVSLPLPRGFSLSTPKRGHVEEKGGGKERERGGQRDGPRTADAAERGSGRSSWKTATNSSRKDKKETKHPFVTLLRIVVFCGASRHYSPSQPVDASAGLSSLGRAALLGAPGSDASKPDADYEADLPSRRSSDSAHDKTSGGCAYYVNVPLKALLSRGVEGQGTVWLALSRAEGKLAPLAPWQMDFYNDGFSRAVGTGMDLSRPKVSVAFQLAVPEGGAQAPVPPQSARVSVTRRMQQLEKEVDQVYRQADVEIQRYRAALKAAEEQKGKVTSFLRDFESPAFKQMESECHRLRKHAKQAEEAARAAETERLATIQKLQHELKTARILLRSRQRRSRVSPSPRSAESPSPAQPVASIPPQESDLSSLQAGAVSAPLPPIPGLSAGAARTMAILKKKISELEEQNASAKQELEQAERQKEALRIELHMVKRNLDLERSRSLVQRKALEECRAQLTLSGRRSASKARGDQAQGDRPEARDSARTATGAVGRGAGTETGKSLPEDAGSPTCDEASASSASAGPSCLGVSATPPAPSAYQQRLRSQRLSLGLSACGLVGASSSQRDSDAGKSASLPREHSFSALFPSLAASLSGTRLGLGVGPRRPGRAERRTASEQRAPFSRISSEEKQMLLELKTAALQAIPSLQAIAKAHATASERRSELARRTRARQAGPLRLHKAEKDPSDPKGEGAERKNSAEPLSTSGVGRREATEQAWTDEEESSNGRSGSSSQSRSRVRAARRPRVSRCGRKVETEVGESSSEDFEDASVTAKRLASPTGNVQRRRSPNRGKGPENAPRASRPATQNDGQTSNSDEGRPSSLSSAPADAASKRQIRQSASLRRRRGKRCGHPKRPTGLSPVCGASPSALERCPSTRSSLSFTLPRTASPVSRDGDIEACMQSASGGNLRASIQTLLTRQKHRLTRRLKRAVSVDRRSGPEPKTARPFAGDASSLSCRPQAQRVLKQSRKGARGQSTFRGTPGRHVRLRALMRIRRAARSDSESTSGKALARSQGGAAAAVAPEVTVAPRKTTSVVEAGKGAGSASSPAQLQGRLAPSVGLERGETGPKEVGPDARGGAEASGEEREETGALGRLPEKVRYQTELASPEAQEECRSEAATRKGNGGTKASEGTNTHATPDEARMRLMISPLGPRFLPVFSGVSGLPGSDAFKPTPISPELTPWSPSGEGPQARGRSSGLFPLPRLISPLSDLQIGVHPCMRPPGRLPSGSGVRSLPHARSAERLDATGLSANLVSQSSSPGDSCAEPDELTAFLEATRALEEETHAEAEESARTSSCATSEPRGLSDGFHEEVFTLEPYIRNGREGEVGRRGLARKAPTERPSLESEGVSSPSDAEAPAHEDEVAPSQGQTPPTQGEKAVLSRSLSGAQTVAGAALQRIAMRVKAEEAASRERELRKAQEGRSPAAAGLSSPSVSAASHDELPSRTTAPAFAPHASAPSLNGSAAKNVPAAMTQPLPAGHGPSSLAAISGARLEGLPRQKTAALPAARLHAGASFLPGAGTGGQASGATRSVVEASRVIDPAGPSREGGTHWQDAERNIVGSALPDSLALTAAGPAPGYLSVGRAGVVSRASSPVLSYGSVPARTTLRPSPASPPLPPSTAASASHVGRGASPEAPAACPVHVHADRASLKVGQSRASAAIGAAALPHAHVRVSPLRASALPAFAGYASPASASLSRISGCMRSTTSTPGSGPAEGSAYFSPAVPAHQADRLSTLVGAYQRRLQIAGQASGPGLWKAGEVETEKARGVLGRAFEPQCLASNAVYLAQDGRSATELREWEVGGVPGREPASRPAPAFAAKHLVSAAPSAMMGGSSQLLVHASTPGTRFVVQPPQMEIDAGVSVASPSGEGRWRGDVRDSARVQHLNAARIRDSGHHVSSR
ncbi:conserved hypothetical protein [Neospora caninum Liverpool]|uniref:Uncharacterized protein n=1 Tax=Neospora caninum (strain Liverpool) TaxID=572307 RepID=F0VCI9_NEOCL|nr:conserved hypothetical protein [Neospora caninum Liverpool]CBZ51678.1 conserved hypothetical protein [Neospora caninum Liverpool]CEL65632.1 TPA: hypothetical protein BN1204_014720 [Neospora caninum Liverpool]|eukprot:XP_003881711.1 conserved hypothetical protein [Neospora caninum Liverpool]